MTLVCINPDDLPIPETYGGTLARVSESSSAPFSMRIKNGGREAV
jgi:hypothetical protein